MHFRGVMPVMPLKFSTHTTGATSWDGATTGVISDFHWTGQIHSNSRRTGTGQNSGTPNGEFLWGMVRKSISMESNVGNP